MQGPNPPPHVADRKIRVLKRPTPTVGICGGRLSSGGYPYGICGCRRGAVVLSRDGSVAVGFVAAGTRTESVAVDEEQ